jgi:HSP20 family protein
VKLVDNRQHPAMDWEEFQRSLFKQLPFFGNEMAGKNIQQFVQKAIKNHMPKSMPYDPNLHGFMSKSVDYELFETHRSLFVRCRLPEDISLRNIRFFSNRRQLRIEYDGHSEDIALPSDVNTNRTIAKVHDGILEIRMPKLTDSDPLREIFIRD